MPEPPWKGRLRTANTLYELEENVTTIGRDPGNDLVLDARGTVLHARGLLLSTCGRTGYLR